MKLVSQKTFEDPNIKPANFKSPHLLEVEWTLKQVIKHQR